MAWPLCHNTTAYICTVFGKTRIMFSNNLSSIKDRKTLFYNVLYYFVRILHLYSLFQIQQVCDITNIVILLYSCIFQNQRTINGELVDIFSYRGKEEIFTIIECSEMDFLWHLCDHFCNFLIFSFLSKVNRQPLNCVVSPLCRKIWAFVYTVLEEKQFVFCNSVWKKLSTLPLLYLKKTQFLRVYMNSPFSKQKHNFLVLCVCVICVCIGFWGKGGGGIRPEEATAVKFRVCWVLGWVFGVTCRGGNCREIRRRLQ